MATASARTGRLVRGFNTTEILEVLLKGRAFISLILVFAVFTTLNPRFISTSNLLIIADQVSINALLAIGMTFVILTAGIDLSVGSIAGLTAMIVGGFIHEGIRLESIGLVVYPHTLTAIVLALAVGALIGAVSGVIITRFNVAPFIATLGMLYIARGFAGIRRDGQTFPNLVGEAEFGNTGFGRLGAGELLGIRYAIWIMVVFALVAYFLSARTTFGRHVYAIGGNERSAALSGVPVARTKILVYTISGLCAAMAGVIIASRLLAAHPNTGFMFELNAIAAVVLGGTSLAGGRGSIRGTIIGAFVIGALMSGLVTLGVSSFWQRVIIGTVIIVALILDQIQERIQDRLSLQRQSAAEEPTQQQPVASGV